MLQRYIVSLATTVGAHVTENQVLIEATTQEGAIRLADNIASGRVETVWKSIIPVNSNTRN